MLGFLSETRKEQVEQSCLNDWPGKNVIRSEQELELIFIFALEYCWFFKNCGEIDLKLNHGKGNNSGGI